MNLSAKSSFVPRLPYLPYKNASERRTKQHDHTGRQVHPCPILLSFRFHTT